MSEANATAAEVRIFHIHETSGGRRKTWWVAASAAATMAGRVGESRAGLLKRWVAKHGKPGKWTRIEGWCTRAEVAAALVDYQGGI